MFRIILSYILYYLGHFTSLFFRFDCLALLLYPVYKWLMVTSCDLDPEGKVWKN